MKKANATYLVKVWAKNEGGKSVLVDSQYVTVKRNTNSTSRYENYRQNVETVLGQIATGSNDYINVGDKAYGKVWAWYFQNGVKTDHWCGAFAHYVLNLSGVDTGSYKYESGTDVYDKLETGDMVVMNNNGHIGVVYVDGDTKYVIHGNVGNGSYKTNKVSVNKIERNGGINWVPDMWNTGYITGYISMENFLSNNTDVDVTDSVPTDTFCLKD